MNNHANVLEHLVQHALAPPFNPPPPLIKYKIKEIIEISNRGAANTLGL